MLKVKGVWYVNQLPDYIVIELEDGKLVKALMTTFKDYTEKDFSDYKGHHPRKCKGQPLPNYLFRFYGLAKDEETASEVIHIRVTPSEKAKIETYAANLEGKQSVSDVVRDYIKGL